MKEDKGDSAAVCSHTDPYSFTDNKNGGAFALQRTGHSTLCHCPKTRPGPAQVRLVN